MVPLTMKEGKRGRPIGSGDPQAPPEVRKYWREYKRKYRTKKKKQK